MWQAFTTGWQSHCIYCAVLHHCRGTSFTVYTNSVLQQSQQPVNPPQASCNVYDRYFSYWDKPGQNLYRGLCEKTKIMLINVKIKQPVLLVVSESCTISWGYCMKAKSRSKLLLYITSDRIILCGKHKPGLHQNRTAFLHLPHITFFCCCFTSGIRCILTEQVREERKPPDSVNGRLNSREYKNQVRDHRKMNGDKTMGTVATNRLVGELCITVPTWNHLFVMLYHE